MSATTWLTHAELREILKLSTAGLDQLRQDGVLIPGRDFIRKGANKRSPLLFDLAACEAALRDHTVTTAARWENYSPAI